MPVHIFDGIECSSPNTPTDGQIVIRYGVERHELGHVPAIMIGARRQFGSPTADFNTALDAAHSMAIAEAGGYGGDWNIFILCAQTI